MTPLDRMRAISAAVRAHPLDQWSQKDSSSVHYAGHSTGCGHTEWQRMIYLWTGKAVTIDEISQVVGYSTAQLHADEGLTVAQVRRIIAHYKLPYDQPQYHGSAAGIIDAVRNIGPVNLCVGYAQYPQWLNAPSYSGGVPNGQPNGYAVHGGRNDLGFTGGHDVTVLAARWRRDLKEFRIRLSDPDHGSSRRPEVPVFDIIRGSQFTHLVDSGKAQFGAVVAYLPTREWKGVPK